MTAEQLEELLRQCGTMQEHWWKVELGPGRPPERMRAQDFLKHLAPSLARKVIAAEKLREALGGLEEACNKLASTRTHGVYLSMIDSGQSDDLMDLDNARKSARQALTAYREASK